MFHLIKSRSSFHRQALPLLTKCSRFCSTDSSKPEAAVRVRFAPSPTGFLHLGGLRTALYNYLYAKSQNGQFILRIEDTDQTRLVPGATEQLITDLKWSGIKIDEGPGIGGKHEPYLQSQRLSLYNNAMKKLLENGTAYYCFCTEKRLELLRKEATRAREVPKYDNKCRSLTPVQIAKNLGKNLPFCVRFKLSYHADPFKDLVYGDISYNVSENEGDPVIIKSDGFPTYHFANVVDDHFMGISHVFRGVEWQISTTKHILLYKAFNWTPPQFGHLPLLVNSDGTKLSKRQGDIHISQYRDRGIFPEALANFVMGAGGGFNRKPGDNNHIYTLSELAEMFDVSRLNSHPSRLNHDLLNDFNRMEIQRRIDNKEACEKLVKEVSELVLSKYSQNYSNLDLDESHVKNILSWSSNRICTLKDLVDAKLSFLWIRPTVAILSDLTEENLQDLLCELEESTFHKDDLNVLLKNYAEKNNFKFSKMMKTFRSAISGLKEGPGVAEMMEILGKQVSINRLKENLKTKT
ncbi:EARS2 family protein [Megaselia abdita]